MHQRKKKIKVERKFRLTRKKNRTATSTRRAKIARTRAERVTVDRSPGKARDIKGGKEKMSARDRERERESSAGVYVRVARRCGRMRGVAGLGRPLRWWGVSAARPEKEGKPPLLSARVSPLLRRCAR